MLVAMIYIEHAHMNLDRPFMYFVNGLKVKKGMRVKVPFHHKSCIGLVEELKEIEEEELQNIPYTILEIESLYDQEPILNEELFTLANFMAKQYITSKMKCFQCILPSKLKPKSARKKIKQEVWVRFLKEKENAKIKEQNILMEMRQNGPMLRKQFRQEYKTIGDRLIKEGYLEMFQQEAQAKIEDLHFYQSKFQLTEGQKRAIEEIGSCIYQPKLAQLEKVFLLHGVTGSGKSEVFLQLTNMALQKQQQILILVPEIALTSEMVKQIRESFGNHLAIYHSRLNNQELYEQYRLIQQQKVSIVIGTRSAIFMPFVNLGLIILDEEHDASYKQDQAPCYHCRDLAIERGKWHRCPVVLASATPSLESYARAYKNVYQLVDMPTRINHELPKVNVIDMKEEMKKGNGYLLAPVVMNKIKECLCKRQQVIVLLNRRGYSPVLRCSVCGEVVKCPNCDVLLNYHKDCQKLRCHICDYQQKLISSCRNCGSSNLQLIGYGIQKLEEFMQTQFPQAKILRMDADTTHKKGAHEAYIQQFHRHEKDILIGTQMIAKGLDFEKVALVVIVNADAALNRSDYRNSEITFDLLSQACGRSGRHGEGEVYIQGFDIDHYAIQCAKTHNYKMFFSKEMKYRHLGQYPPFVYLATLVVTHQNDLQLNKDIELIQKVVSTIHLKVLGPSFLGKRNHMQRARFIIKSKDYNRLNQSLWMIYYEYQNQKGKSHLEINVNPLTLE